MNFHIPGPETDGDGVHLAPRTHHYNHSHAQPDVHFKHPVAQPTDPSLGPGRGNTPGDAMTPSQHLHPHDHCVPGGFYGDASRNPMTPPSVRSPNFPSQSLPRFTPADRSLPGTDVTDDTIDEAYAQFILYCNPSFAVTTDTTELKKAFRQPPRSDGKLFSTWTLLQLVKRYEDKEIKTWVELALELGVEKPALDKGQSTQKVQQYSVRLKRWLRAMHVDAFFDYLRGRAKEYYLQLPPLRNPYPEEGRDGVPAEEDLAIRALDPSMHPKRGRRKADEMDEDVGDRAATPPDPKRPQLDDAMDFSSPVAFANLHSAYPQDYESADPWTAASAITPTRQTAGHFRWKFDTPATPHPLSAVTPASAHPDSAWGEEPTSGLTPRRTRRRHGPMVSSAWSSTANTPNGKLRGRPPSNRTVRDGPFSTFPAKLGVTEAPPLDLNRTPNSSAAPSFPPLSIPRSSAPQDGTESPVPLSTTSTQAPSSAKRDRERLQLLVPQHKGGPVHLIPPPTTGATPPTVLVNGEERRSTGTESPRHAVFFADSSGDEPAFTHGHGSDYDYPGPSIAGAAATAGPLGRPRPPPAVAREQHNRPSPVPGPTQHQDLFSIEDLKRALAHDLLRASLTGRSSRRRLRGFEAKGLAAAMLNRIESQSSEQTATLLGLGIDLGAVGARGRGGEGKRICVTRFRVGEDGYDNPVDEDGGEDEVDVEAEMDGAPDEGAGGKRLPPVGRIREVFDVGWRLIMGGLTGDFQINGLVISDQ